MLALQENICTTVCLLMLPQPRSYLGYIPESASLPALCTLQSPFWPSILFLGKKGTDLEPHVLNDLALTFSIRWGLRNREGSFYLELESFSIPHFGKHDSRIFCLNGVKSTLKVFVSSFSRWPGPPHRCWQPWGVVAAGMQLGRMCVLGAGTWEWDKRGSLTGRIMRHLYLHLAFQVIMKMHLSR